MTAIVGIGKVIILAISIDKWQKDSSTLAGPSSIQLTMSKPVDHLFGDVETVTRHAGSPSLCIVSTLSRAVLNSPSEGIVN